LAQEHILEGDVRTALNELAVEGYLDWFGTDVVHVTADQMKRLQRFYKGQAPYS